MNKLVFEKGIVKRWGRKWGWQGVEVETKLLLDIQLDPYREFVDNIRGKKIDTEGAIYFQKQAVFPRHKLKEIVKNPVTRDIQKAEYVVINKEHLQNFLRGGWLPYYHKKQAGDTFWQQGMGRSGGCIDQQFRDVEPGGADEKLYELILNLEDKKIILDEDLSALVPREIEVKGELFPKLQKLLSSEDKTNIKVGIQILSNLNYNEFECETLILLNEHIEHINKMQCQHIVIFKSLIKTVKQDYPHWDTTDKLRFILTLLKRNEKNPVALQYIDGYFQKVHPLMYGSTYQISIIEKQIREKIEECELVLQKQKI